MAKRINIKHDFIEPGASSLVMLPLGRYVNDKLKDISNGTVVDVWSDSRREQRTVLGKCVLSVNTPVFNLLFKFIYGQEASFKAMLERWNADALVNGLGGVYSESVLLIELA